MTGNVLTSRSVEDFFDGALRSALDNQRIEATPDSVHYVVGLLTAFSRSDRFYEHTEHGYGLKPLATMYGDAVFSKSTSDRAQALRRLGDVALFISGLFSNSLNRKLVDVDYYIAMGGGAYAQLSSSLSSNRRETALAPVFDELSEKFKAFVDALAEVGEDAHFNNDADLLRSYELWLRTGSRRAEKQLRKKGLHPSATNISRSRH